MDPRNNNYIAEAWSINLGLDAQLLPAAKASWWCIVTAAVVERNAFAFHIDKTPAVMYFFDEPWYSSTTILPV